MISKSSSVTFICSDFTKAFESIGFVDISLHWNGTASLSDLRRANFCHISPSSTPLCWAFVMYSIKLQAFGSSNALAITWAKSALDTDVIFLFIFFSKYIRGESSKKRNMMNMWHFTSFLKVNYNYIERLTFCNLTALESVLKAVL